METTLSTAENAHEITLAGKKISLYVPSTLNVLNGTLTVDTAEIADNLAADIGSITGGASVALVHGAWHDTDTGKIVRENVYVVYTFVDDDNARYVLQHIQVLAAQLKAALQQKSVMVTVESGYALFT